jgi:hypothetical protein
MMSKPRGVLLVCCTDQLPGDLPAPALHPLPAQAYLTEFTDDDNVELYILTKPFMVNLPPASPRPLAHTAYVGLQLPPRPTLPPPAPARLPAGLWQRVPLQDARVGGQD